MNALPEFRFEHSDTTPADSPYYQSDMVNGFLPAFETNSDMISDTVESGLVSGVTSDSMEIPLEQPVYHGKSYLQN